MQYACWLIHQVKKKKYYSFIRDNFEKNYHYKMISKNELLKLTKGLSLINYYFLHF